MKACDFDKAFGEDADYWGEDDEFSLGHWQYEVFEDSTRLGYWDWVIAQREKKEAEKETNNG